MATVARTKQDVDKMTRQDRLWDSLSHSYGQQIEETGKSYDRAYSQADRQALSRGMQRSSYNAQNLANINQQRINAENNIRSNMIADYENRLGALESEEAEAERWERQFNAGREDAQWNREFQQKQADTANQQWQLNFDASRADTAWNQGMQERQFAANQDQNAWQRGMTEKQYADNRADTAWNQGMQERQFAANQDQNAWQRGMTERQYADNRADTAWNQRFQREQFDANQAQNAWQRGMTERQYADNRADTAWQQGMTERQYADNRADTAWQQGMTERQYADSRADTAWNQNFQQSQADRAAEQWERAFEQSNMTDDQKLAAGYVASIIAAGNTPSDELLARAGLSREDAEAMKSSITGNSSGGGNGGNGNGGENPPPGNPNGLFSDMPTSSDLAGNNGGVDGNAVLNWINKHPASTPESTPSIRVQSPNAYKDALEGQIVGDGLITIDPIEAAFTQPEEEYYEVDLDNENDPHVLRLNKTTNGAGGKIKSTFAKKSK